MAERPRRGRKRRPRKGKKPRGSGNKNLLLQFLGGGIILILIVFLIAAGTIDSTLGTIKVFDKGTAVDVYHEAWHGFSQLYL